MGTAYKKYKIYCGERYWEATTKVGDDFCCAYIGRKSVSNTYKGIGMDIKSNTAVSLNHIAVTSEMPSTSEVVIYINNSNSVPITVVVNVDTEVQTSSTSYDGSDWITEGCLQCNVVDAGYNRSVLWFDDGCVLEYYNFVLDFYYDNEYIGSIGIEGGS